MSVDEELYPFRGRCKYIQYMPSKPAKYGLKFWLHCDSETFFIHGIDMYCGKEECEVGLGQHIVMKLASPILNTGRNITTDNLFTSLALAR